MIISDQEVRLANHFAQFISEHKLEFIERVLNNRTRYLTVVLENIYQSQNASAVIRTCECLGIQDVHIIESASKWSTNKQVLKGSNKWLNLIRYRKKGSNNILDCYRHLHDSGYRIAVADPSPDGVPIHEIPVDQPVALVMGNEKHGSSREAIDHADMRVHIPMTGFTESLNISVSAAIALFTTLTRLRESTAAWRITDEEKDSLRLQWYRKIVRRSELIEQEFMRSNR